MVWDLTIVQTLASICVDATQYYDFGILISKGKVIRPTLDKLVINRSRIQTQAV